MCFGEIKYRVKKTIPSERGQCVCSVEENILFGSTKNMKSDSIFLPAAIIIMSFRRKTIVINSVDDLQENRSFFIKMKLLPCKAVAHGEPADQYGSYYLLGALKKVTSRRSILYE